ncbi:hypothetical protein PAECIP111893_04444 [Paenibacillus plantiphilus]|uniref:Phage tail collar domain-containing protein n=1 Tax=Paenibacillus plantiphilus TaxID=2905650 RepID=A0ABN8GW72_9BACL|nr:tail fiber protein [Paenibacillus plantiphilus]CAH1218556.1 hypothetical protein PAECIP111893_04444 [Paenibacillus plantiphilus]
MSDMYVGEIRMFTGNYAPVGWAMCNGQLLSISQNEVLYTLIGTTYGGDGRTTFALPDLQGRLPIHMNSSYPIGAKSGTESVTLLSTQMPAHTHIPNASNVEGTNANPANAVWSATTVVNVTPYAATAPNTAMNPQSIGNAGGSQPHDNMMPFLTVSFIIALQGIFPSQG